jgi:hypothetical protein
MPAVFEKRADQQVEGALADLDSGIVRLFQRGQYLALLTGIVV